MKINFWSKCFLAITISYTLGGCSSKAVDFYSFSKIDAHSHIYSKSPLIMELAQKDNFKWLSVITESRSQKYIDEQLSFAIYQKEN